MKKVFFILLGSMALIVIAIGVFVINKPPSLVTISLDDGVKARIVEQSSTSSDSLTDSRTVADFQTSFSKKLKRGSYVLITDSQKYENISRQFTVGPKPIVLNFRLNSSLSELSSDLVTQQAAIDQAFSDYLLKHKLASGYSFSLQKGSLYGLGEWYGALLVASNRQIDTMRIVFKKIGGSWVVASDPPNIILSIVDYPDIPKDVLSRINSVQP